jgi:hypothetical protein
MTTDEMVTVVVTVEKQVPMQAKFKVTVPRKDAKNHDVLLKACDEQVQDEQDAFGYDEPQAGDWHYIGELQYGGDIDIAESEVISSEITGVVASDEEDEDDD